MYKDISLKEKVGIIKRKIVDRVHGGGQYNFEIVMPKIGFDYFIVLKSRTRTAYGLIGYSALCTEMAEELDIRFSHMYVDYDSKKNTQYLYLGFSEYVK